MMRWVLGGCMLVVALSDVAMGYASSVVVWSTETNGFDDDEGGVGSC